MEDLIEESDYADCIQRVRHGDERAAEELVRRYEPEIRLEIRTWLRLRDPRLRRVFDSMDICQSVLAQFFARATVGDFSLDEPAQLIRLLVGMARISLAEKVRFHQRQRRDVRRLGKDTLEDILLASDGETPSQYLSRREMLEKFRERLTPEERRTADLRAQGFDWVGIAREIGGTSEARRKQLARAIERVERELGLDSD